MNLISDLIYGETMQDDQLFNQKKDQKIIISI
jgi:hypothetical protein